MVSKAASLVLLRTCLQVAKALLLRYHPLFTTLTDKVETLSSIKVEPSSTCSQREVSTSRLPLCVLQLFSLLDDADLGPVAADGFSLLMSDSPDVLNRACHADVRIMYRQRFFSENSAKLVQGFNAAPRGSDRTDREVPVNI